MQVHFPAKNTSFSRTGGLESTNPGKEEREKSATKEAIGILEKYIVSNPDAKRRKICTEDANEERNGSGEGVPNEHVNSESGSSIEKSDILSLVKLTRSGLVLFKFPFDKSPAVVDKRNHRKLQINRNSEKFAVGYNRRGIEETEMKNLKKKLLVILSVAAVCYNRGSCKSCWYKMESLGRWELLVDFVVIIKC
ncbi:hypothetical protein RND71_002416 [Anisodus tanguticus]|uniref:Uncharacterized protein n=1 Tax=Anisodus tanguticus TaxID=243964 RepID=A0AAE1T2M6_9SOLA|nr:hypothetical protein RND71_002416 [Anisodus tanguticus]